MKIITSNPLAGRPRVLVPPKVPTPTDFNDVRIVNNFDNELETDETASYEFKQPLKSTSQKDKFPTRILLIALIATLVWLFAEAPMLDHNAQVSGIGTRRSAALAILNPISDISKRFHLNYPVNQLTSILGRNKCSLCSLPVTIGNRSRSSNRPKIVKQAPSIKTSTTIAVPSFTMTNPLKILSVGDSLGEDIGYSLANSLSSFNNVSTTVDAQTSTGLTRKDYFDWQARLQQDIATYNPNLIIVLFGANDPQSYFGSGPDIPFGTQAWIDKYSSRVKSFMEEAVAGNRQVIWVGAPPMENTGLSNAMALMDQIYQSVASQVKGVTYLNPIGIVTTPSGSYTEYLTSQSGQQIEVRTPDGIHLAPGGSQLVANSIISYVNKIWRLNL